MDRVPICSCVLVTGLKKETTDDTIELYFENEKRSGGKDVSQVERKGKDQALVYFEDPSSKKRLLFDRVIDMQTTKRVNSYYIYISSRVIPM